MTSKPSPRDADTRLIRGNDAYKINQDSISPHYAHLLAITYSETDNINSACHNKSACRSHEWHFLRLLCIKALNNVELDLLEPNNTYAVKEDLGNNDNNRQKGDCSAETFVKSGLDSA